ncbi:GLPGLI family protein [Saccharicrinis aurantiacus]|uniref:GLPGLI family protein n=1 Tax=Saccharicrinis aurantiacus TaxID=1849719 RepID=UPI002491147A|nr:GLPGLI family protein [Saccharicrinis aurantiacus]
MKKITILLSLMLPVLLNAAYKPTLSPVDTVQYLATYKYDYQEDSTSALYKGNAYMCLQIGNRLCRFAARSRITTDSIHVALKNTDSNLRNSSVQKAFVNDFASTYFARYSIFSGLNVKSIDFYEGTYKPYHFYEETCFNWNFVADSDTTIAGYLCKKALTSYRGRNFEAWYTLEIPFSKGPFKFNGLPGLIVKIKDTKEEHVFELSSFKKVNYESLIYTVDYKKSNLPLTEIEADDYFKLKRNIQLERLGIFGNPDIKLDPEKLDEVSQKILRRNNQIDKY